MSRKVESKVDAISSSSSSSVFHPLNHNHIITSLSPFFLPSVQSPAKHNGVHSFLKWFKKKDTNGAAAPRSITAQRNAIAENSLHFIDDDDSTSDTISVPSSSPSLSLSSLSSRGSLNSTATTGFAFISPDQYTPYGNALFGLQSNDSDYLLYFFYRSKLPSRMSTAVQILGERLTHLNLSHNILRDATQIILALSVSEQ